MIRRFLLPAFFAAFLLMSCGDESNPADPKDPSDTTKTDTTTTLTPKADSFSPTCGPVGTRITIEGSGFGSDASKIEVHLGNDDLKLISVAPTRIVAEVEKGTGGEIEVHVGSKETTAPGTFTVVTGVAVYKEAVVMLNNILALIETDSTYAEDGAPSTTSDSGLYKLTTAITVNRATGENCMNGVSGQKLTFDAGDGVSLTEITLDTAAKMVRSFTMTREQTTGDSTAARFEKFLIYLKLSASNIPYTVASDGSLVVEMDAATIEASLDGAITYDSQYYLEERGAKLVQVTVSSVVRRVFYDNPDAQIRIILR